MTNKKPDRVGITIGPSVVGEGKKRWLSILVCDKLPASSVVME